MLAFPNQDVRIIRQCKMHAICKHINRSVNWVLLCYSHTHVVHSTLVHRSSGLCVHCACVLGLQAFGTTHTCDLYYIDYRVCLARKITPAPPLSHMCRPVCSYNVHWTIYSPCSLLCKRTEDTIAVLSTTPVAGARVFPKYCRVFCAVCNCLYTAEAQCVSNNVHGG